MREDMKEVQCREIQGKISVSGSQDERERECKKDRKENGWAVYFGVCLCFKFILRN